jgi:hypothetical protein
VCGCFLLSCAVCSSSNAGCLWHRPIRPSQKGDLEMRERCQADHSLRKDLEAVVAQAVPAAS